MKAEITHLSRVFRKLFHKLYCKIPGGVQKALHILVVLALLSAELAPAVAYAAPFHQEETTPTPLATTTVTPTDTETTTPTATGTISPTLTVTLPYTPTATFTLSYTPTIPSEPPGSTPTDIPSETPTAIPTPTATIPYTPTPEPPPATSTPTPTPSGTISPTQTVAPTATITPTPGVSLTLEVRPAKIKAGGVLHTGWQIEGWQAGMVLTLTVPVSFTLQVNPGGVFDPATGTLTILLTKDHGMAGWRIPEDLEGPYPINAALSLEGVVIASRSLTLEETGLTHVPAGGGIAFGLQGKVRVTFPPGAAGEDMKVYVHPPREETTPPYRASPPPTASSPRRGMSRRGIAMRQWEITRSGILTRRVMPRLAPMAMKGEDVGLAPM